MNRNGARVMMKPWQALALLLAVLFFSATLPACEDTSTPDHQSNPTGPSPSSPGPSRITGLAIYFKLDPKLGGGTYGGAVWVSPPTYVGIAGQDTVDARTEGVGAPGQTVRVSADWLPSDPSMVSVSPARGELTTISIKRAGQSSLKVTSSGFTRDLIIRATVVDGSMHVEITQ